MSLTKLDKTRFKETTENFEKFVGSIKDDDQQKSELLEIANELRRSYEFIESSPKPIHTDVVNYRYHCQSGLSFLKEQFDKQPVEALKKLEIQLKGIIEDTVKETARLLSTPDNPFTINHQKKNRTLRNECLNCIIS